MDFQDLDALSARESKRKRRTNWSDLKVDMLLTIWEEFKIGLANDNTLLDRLSIVEIAVEIIVDFCNFQLISWFWLFPNRIHLEAN